MFLLLDPIQKFDPVNGEGDGSEILFYLSLQDVRSHLVQHVAKPVINFREEDRFIDAGGVLEGDELHGIAVLGLNRLTCDQPADGGYMLTYVEMKIAGLHVMQSL